MLINLMYSRTCDVSAPRQFRTCNGTHVIRYTVRIVAFVPPTIHDRAEKIYSRIVFLKLEHCTIARVWPPSSAVGGFS